MSRPAHNDPSGARDRPGHFGLRLLRDALAMLVASAAISAFIAPSERAGSASALKSIHKPGHEPELILPAAAHEGRDVGPRFIAGAFALLIVSLAVITLSVLWLFPMPSLDRTLRGSLPTYPQPHLQPSPRQEMQRFRAEEMLELNTYGWIDKQHGIVHLPIDVAMDEIAKRGIPGWPTPPAQSADGAAPAQLAGDRKDARP